MAFSSAFRRVINGSSSASPSICSHLLSIRLNSTLTTPRLFINGLSKKTTDKKLKKTFWKFGDLAEAKVIVDRLSGRSKGFAYVTYKSIEDAEKAREGMNARFLDGWVIFVTPAKPPRSERPQSEQPQSKRPLHHH